MIPIRIIALCCSLGAISFASLCPGADATAGISKQVVAKDFSRKTIYHSPQTPGYTCWLGAWIMPDKSLMVCFTQNTGPLEGRGRAPEKVRQQFYPFLEKPLRDATDLEKAILFFRSTDGGATWTRTGEIPFTGPMAYCGPGGQETLLKDGSILKGIYGFFQPLNPEVPQSAYLLRSSDLGKTWSKPQVLCDPAKDNLRLTRIRRLHDGRLLATGGRARTPSTSTSKLVWELWEPLLLVSEDDGRSWTGPIQVLNEEQRKGWRSEEYDTAELPNGDLLCVFRRFDPANPKTQVRWQGLLKKTGKSWTLEKLGPSVLPHSGHPELLVTREGIILHIATTGMHWTKNGETWTEVQFPSLKDGYHSRYYPKAVQTEDGQIYVFGHLGSDNDYQARDQCVDLDRFRLTLTKPAAKAATAP